MSTVIDQNMRAHAAQPLNSMVSKTAANDDHLPVAKRRDAAETTAGWDAHDVWRRLIKEARERREVAEKLPQ
jgi:hypothetical protein